MIRKVRKEANWRITLENKKASQCPQQEKDYLGFVFNLHIKNNKGEL